MSLRDALLEAVEESCAVALPRQRNCATPHEAANDALPDPEEWLRNFLADHIVPVQAVMDAAKEAGISSNSLALAAEDLLVRVMRSDSKTYWAMPQKRTRPRIPAPDWRPLAAAYHQHHMGCPTCVAAGKGYGARCPVGATLWQTYGEAS